MDFSFETQGPVEILRLKGELDSQDVPDLNAAFDRRLESSETARFVCDLSELEFIDSAGLGGLISCLRKSINRGGDLRICGLQAKPRMVFEITRAHKVFRLYDTPKAAMESFGG